MPMKYDAATTFKAIDGQSYVRNSHGDSVAVYRAGSWMNTRIRNDD